jgi:hypothetical protein
LYQVDLFFYRDPEELEQKDAGADTRADDVGGVTGAPAATTWGDQPAAAPLDWADQPADAGQNWDTAPGW